MQSVSNEQFQPKLKGNNSPRAGVVPAAAAVLVLQCVPPAPDDGVDGVGDELGPDVGLAEAMRDGLAEDEGRDAGRHRDAHGHEQHA